MATAFLSSSFWARLLLMAAPSVASPLALPLALPLVSQLYEFTYPTAVQDLFALPNNCLLFSVSDAADLYYINPEALYPAAQNVITIPDTTALNDITALEGDLYAVSSGSTGSMQIHVVKVATEGNVNVTLDHSIPVPNVSSLEGMVALPKSPRVILTADSSKGSIIRVDTSANTVAVAFTHDALNLGAGESALGIKGLRIRDGYLYFTNAGQGVFGRFPIDDQGASTGDVEILAHLDGADGAFYDGFSFDSEGNAFVAVHPSSIYKIAPDGSQSTLVGGATTNLLEPTSVVVSIDGKSIYVSTAGMDSGFPITGGQVMKVQLL